MFGLSVEKLMIIGFLAVIIVGPQRLPVYATTLGRWAKRARLLMNDARSRLSEEIGPEFDDVDWQKLDPRQYDPRRIVREALLEPVPSSRKRAKETPPPPSAEITDKENP